MRVHVCDHKNLTEIILNWLHNKFIYGKKRSVDAIFNWRIQSNLIRCEWTWFGRVGMVVSTYIHIYINIYISIFWLFVCYDSLQFYQVLEHTVCLCISVRACVCVFVCGCVCNWIYAYFWLFHIINHYPIIIVIFIFAQCVIFTLQTSYSISNRDKQHIFISICCLNTSSECLFVVLEFSCKPNST